MLKQFKKSLKTLIAVQIVFGGLSLANNDLLSNNSYASGVGLSTGFPLPRFVSTKSEKANVRTGPGKRYPVNFVYKQKVPLQVVDEYLLWRKVRNWDGEEGWVHKALLSSKKLAIINVPITYMYNSEDIKSKIKAKIWKDVIVTVESCSKGWCYSNIKSVNIEGYIKKSDLWGIEKK